MLKIYRVKGAEVKVLFIPDGAALKDVLKVLKLDKAKVKITIEEIIP